jgi:hypothetical protein
MPDLLYRFAVSGVETWLWLPPLVAFAVSFFTSMVGISGAFLLLPFQLSVLGYTAPGVSATNLVYNLVATPGGVYRYLREGRMLWPLTWVVIAGTLPGIALGYWLRVAYLRDVEAFKAFAGLVLLYLGYRLVRELLLGAPAGAVGGPPGASRIAVLAAGPARVELEFRGARYGFDTRAMFALALAVGVIGGVYGIGGGAIIAPFCVSLFGLPVYVVAGAALAGTLFTSIVGVAFYALAPAPAGVATQPDWLLGLLFGLGGLAGMYSGARLQKHVPQRVLKTGLAALLLVLAAFYIL